MPLGGVRAGKVLEAVIVFVGAIAVGALVGRWWLVALPVLAALAWISYAAAFSGDDRDGVPVWQLALMLGGVAAAALMLALAAGVILGRWLRLRRNERRSDALSP